MEISGTAVLALIQGKVSITVLVPNFGGKKWLFDGTFVNDAD